MGGEFIAPKCYYLLLNNKDPYIRCKGIIRPTLEALQELSELKKTSI